MLRDGLLRQQPVMQLKPPHLARAGGGQLRYEVRGLFVTAITTGDRHQTLTELRNVIHHLRF